MVVVVDVKGKAASEDTEEEVRNQIKKRLSSGKVTEHALRSGGDGKAAAIERSSVEDMSENIQSLSNCRSS